MPDILVQTQRIIVTPSGKVVQVISGQRGPVGPQGPPTYGHVGESKWFNMSTLPEGWLLEDGAAVSRTLYEDLFNAIGTTFGDGDGSTTFNLPDSIGRMFLGDSDPGDTGGSADAIVVSHNHTSAAHTHGVGTLATANTGAHTHGQLNSMLTAVLTGGATSIPGAAGPATLTWRAWTATGANGGAHTHTISGTTGSTAPDNTGSTGSSGTGANLPPYIKKVPAIYAGV